MLRISIAQQSFILLVVVCLLSLSPLNTVVAQDRDKASDESSTYNKLTSRETAVRRGAIQNLAKSNDVITKTMYAPLFNALSDEDESVRYYATIVVAKTAYSSSVQEKEGLRVFVPQLLERLEEKNSKIKETALRTIGLIQPPYQTIAAPLSDLSQDASPNIREMVLDIMLLTADSPSATLPFFLRALKEDSSSEVRGIAALRIGKIGHFDDVIVESLINVLDDPTVFVRTSAMNALIAAGAKAEPALKKLKEIQSNTHIDETEREFVDMAVKQISTDVNLKKN